MTRFTAFACLIAATGTNAFVVPSKQAFVRCAPLNSSDEKEVVKQPAFPVGTLVEFAEKKRIHVGKILSSEHKSKGGARYSVEDHDGHKFNIADKAVTYAMPVSPDNARKVNQIFDEFALALEENPMELQKDLDISPELLEMAWEEALEDESHELTPKSLVQLIHSHSASAIESYKAWRLLRSDMAHVFFKELKENGRVVSFKAKAMKAVDSAKKAFCTKPENAEEELCWV
mmetsp:Transcript_29666/g.60581  ORF Transcript_29666/g.60581 Transcript_29666/m.60581 type:complete len:231 (-) Transcript_29666:308-1000(-)